MMSDRDRTAKKQALDELNNWNRVYGNKEEIPKCFTWEILGQEACLIMPYLRPVSIGDRHRLLDDGTILKTLTQFAESGCIHEDVKWRHFGWLEEKDKDPKLILFDLGWIKESTEEQIASWFKESVALLNRKAGIYQQSMPNRNQMQSGRKRKGSTGPLE